MNDDDDGKSATPSGYSHDLIRNDHMITRHQGQTLYAPAVSLLASTLAGAGRLPWELGHWAGWLFAALQV